MIMDTRLFSEREGYTPLQEPLQLESIPRAFRLELELCLMKALEAFNENKRGYTKVQTADWDVLLRDLWVQYFEEPLEHISSGMTYPVEQRIIQIIKHGDFIEVFNLIEELLNRIADQQPHFYKDLQEVFLRKKMAYRLVSVGSSRYAIVPATNEHEALTVTETFDLLSLKGKAFEAVSTHFANAGNKIIDKDYGKSIDESSSAIEATLRILTKCDKEQNAVAEIFAKSIGMHKLFQKQISIPHQIASDISGGRHSTKQEGYVADQYDAQYIFAISCSTVQYLINKQS